MATTPESLVYRGREGSGLAQVFGREGNPMRAYQTRKADIERRRAIEAEKIKLAKAKRDKDLWELINVDPDKAYEPFRRQVTDLATQHRKNIADRLENSGGVVTDDLRLYAKKGWDDINTQAAKSQYIEKTLKETKEAIEKNPYMDYGYYFPKLNELYMDENGNAKPLDQIDAEQIKNIFIADPRGFREEKFFKEFMDGLNENMASYVTQKAQNNGILTQDHETKWKGSLYTQDPNSPIGVRVDERGNPILNITPELINSITSSETAKRYFEAVAEEQGVTLEDVVRERIAPRAGLKQDIKSSFNRDANWYFDYVNANKSGLKPTQIPAATNRANKIRNIINSIGEDGQVTPEAKAAVGALANNTRFADGHVIGATILPGTNTPGTTEALPGTVVSNSPNPRLVLQVKVSDRGLPKTFEINLADPGAAESLNSLFNTSQAEGGEKYSTDQLMRLMNWAPDKLYQGKETLAADNEAAKAAENSLIDKIMNAPIGEEIPEMVGRYEDGKKITSARHIVTDAGWSPGIFGKPWGQKEGIEIEFIKPDGNKEYKHITNPEDIRRILRGEGAQVKLKDSYKVNGKKYSLQELKDLGYTEDQIKEAVSAGTLN